MAPAEDPRALRRRAAALRAIAYSLSNDEARRGLLDVAKSYERSAQRIEATEQMMFSRAFE